MREYYNSLEFSKANDIKWVNPELSLKLFNVYLNKYPYDYTSYPFYIDVLINLNYINKAREIRNKVCKMVMMDTKFQNNTDKMIHFNYGIIYNDIRLSIIDGDYDKAMKLALKYEKQLYNIDNSFSIAGIIFYCKKKLGLLDPERRDNNSYLFRQILDYHEDDFIDHVNKHLSNNKEENLCVFNSDFPFDKVFYEIKNIIPSNKRIHSGMFDDNYFFKYDNCGRADYKITDYFEVVTLLDSCDFITMYPTNISNTMPYIDLNYLKENKKVNEKRISQIDKFYKRYQKK